MAWVFWALPFILPGALQGQADKPDAAVAPVAAIGAISEGEKRIIFNSLQSNLSQTYQLVPQEVYARAEEQAFQDLSLEQCTEEQCIRKIQEYLQVERLIVLQIIREQELAQLTLTLVRADDKIVRADNCPKCGVIELESKVAGLVAAVAAADLGRSVGQPSAPALPVVGEGQVFISSDPPGAKITLDGKSLEQKTDALLEEIPAGEHTIFLSIEKDNLVATQTFTLAADELKRLRVTLKPARVDILVTSRPFDSTVLLDGREVGKTPVRTKTSAGPHRMEIRKEGFLPYSALVEVKPGKLNRINATLTPGGTLHFKDLTAEHSIRVSGKPVETEDDGRVMLPLGSHRVEITREGYEPRSETVTIRAGQTTTLSAQLARLLGYLTIAGTPTGAAVTVQGGTFIPSQVTRTLPLRREPLTIGRYTVTIDQRGFEPVRQTVEVKLREETGLTINLRQLAKATLTIRVDTSGAVVRLDGRKLPGAGTVFTTEVLPGRHDIRVDHPSGEYDSINRTVSLAEGATEEVSFELQETFASRLDSVEGAVTAFWVVGGLTLAYGSVLWFVSVLEDCGLTADTVAAEKQCEREADANAEDGLNFLLLGALLLFAAPDPSQAVGQLQQPAASFAVAPCLTCSSPRADVRFRWKF